MSATTADRYDALNDARDAILALLPPNVDGDRLLERLEDADGEAWFADLNEIIKAVAAHLPGVAGLIRRAYWHVIDNGGTDRASGCCTEDQ